MHGLLKMVLVHKCFPFTSAIIKLYTQIPSEFRIWPNDNMVKYLKSLNWLPGGGGGGVGYSSC